ncbi:MAG TPA: Ig-like domain-containing protein, partial [Rubrobacter sp.]|nr:Ig-like domain-containing protein [Rubrobacter sp.]
IDGDTAKAIFVSRTAGNDAGSGTKDIPLQTIQAGINAASAAEPDKDVYIAGGTYDVLNGGINLADNVGLYGGYTTTFEARSDVTTIRGIPQAILADGDQNVVLQQLTLKGLHVSGPITDLSVYGVRAINASQLALEGVSVVAENGWNGQSGSQGFTPGNASDGSAGSNALNCDTPGAQVTNGGGFGSNRGGNGGAGGEETSNGQPGSPGENGLGGSFINKGAGGTPSNEEPPPRTVNGQPGTIGATGAQGSNGTNANFTTANGAMAWNTILGTLGGAGSSGQGGGGGGGGAGHVGNFIFGLPTAWAAGGGGGGGGSGGQGGGGGGGGQSGGGSFGVYLYNSSLAANASTTIQAGNGGNGGNGGQGGIGGLGGNGGSGGLAKTTCNVTGANGGDGGPGGQGGRGGAGGGGAGGPSAGVFVGGTTSIFAEHNDSAAPMAGTAGLGGHLGVFGTQAESGEAAPMLPAGAAASITSDFDSDGVPDATDACLATVGTVAANGCRGDTTVPTVKSVAPTGTRVVPGANVIATFSEPMNATTVKARGTFTLKKGTTLVGASVNYDAVNRRAILNPTNNLKRGVTYTATLTSAAKDVAGNPLVAKTWKFTIKR